MISVWVYINNFPYIGTVIKTVLGANVRCNYKIAGAKEHPHLREYWNPKKPGGCCGLYKAKLLDPPNSEDQISPFPQTFHKMRGTPEFDPFTDFSNAIFANDRGGVIDNLVNGRARGFRLRFKSGNRTQPGAETMFEIRRSTNYCKTLCEAMGLKRFAPKDKGFEVFGPGGKKAGPIGKVRHSTQASFWEKLCRNRFNKYPKPVYDVLDSRGEIAYTVVVPLDKGRPFLGLFCLPLSYADHDYLAVVPGKRTSDRYGGADKPCAGWVVPLRPRYAQTIDRCLRGIHNACSLMNRITCGGATVLLELFTILDKFCVFFKTLPVDNVTQVPHPGRAHLRCTFPCTHATTACRISMPAKATDPEGGDNTNERALVIAAMILMDMEGILETL